MRRSRPPTYIQEILFRTYQPAVLVNTRVLERRPEKTKKILKIVVFGSQEYCQEKTHIQELRPSCSAMQLHCGLRLFFKKIYLQYGVWYFLRKCIWPVVSILRRLFIFYLDNRAPNNPD